MTESARPGGLFVSLKGLVTTGLGMAKTRLELLVTELEEEKARLLGMLLYGAVAFVLLAAGLLFLAVFLTVLLWDSNRLLVLGVFSALFLGGGVVALMVTLNISRTKSRLLSATLAELERDRAALSSK
jgi:uncharacterized membrane protein YqjE